MNQEIITIYRNLIICLTKYRGLNAVVDGNPAADLTDQNILETINKGYIMIHAHSQVANVKTLIVFMMLPDTEYVKKVPRFKTLVQKVMITKTRDGTVTFKPFDYMIVSKEPLGNTVQKELIMIKKQGRIFVEKCMYHHFVIEKPLHDAMPKHELAEEEEIVFIENLMKISRINFPKITMSDNGVVWTGAHPGQVIKVYRKSESTGTAIGYRVVRP